MAKNLIVLAVTNNYLFSAANVIIGIEKHAPHFFDYLIFVEHKNTLNRQEVSALYDLIDQSYQHNEITNRIVIRDVSEILNSDMDLKEPGIKSFIDRWSVMPLVKIMMYHLFDEKKSRSLGFSSPPDCAIWLDSDILVQGDLRPILNYGSICGALGNWAKPLLNGSPNYPEIDEYDIKPNGGVLVFKRDVLDKVDIPTLDKHVKNILTTLITDLILGIEEHVITLLCKKLKIHLDILGSEFNYLPGYSKHTNPIVIHALGARKFWNNGLINLMFPQWERQNQIWLAKLLKAGVSVNEIHSFNKSTITATSMAQLLNEHDHRNTWSIHLNKIKFSHPLCYQQPCPTSRWIQFYFKQDGIPKDVHYEVIILKSGFEICLHFENKFQCNNQELRTLLSNIAQNFDYSLSFESHKLSLSKLVSNINDVEPELTKLINHTALELLSLIPLDSKKS